jgi:hypothetical protein
MDQEAIVEAVTREVLSVLAGGSWDDYLACIGDCAVHSSDKVRDVVAAGASRISFHGNGAEVPTDIAGYIDHTLSTPPGCAGWPATCAGRMCSPAR